MTRTIDCRVLVTAQRDRTGKPEIDQKIAAPVLTDPEKHRASNGPLESANGSRAISVAWLSDRTGVDLAASKFRTCFHVGADEKRKTLDYPRHRNTMVHCTNREVAGWGPRAQRQTKSVWHSARNGPIAHILLRAEKPPVLYGGLFRRLTKSARREVAGGVSVETT